MNPSQDQRTRAKIQTSQIVNRLNAFVNGQVEMSAHQVTAALGLLRKVLPDMASVEHTGDGAQPFAIIPQQLASAAAWEAAQKPTEAPLPDPAVKH